MQAEHVVNAGGLWAREVGRMVGLELPVLAMEHMYLLTEPMPEVAEFNARPAARWSASSTCRARSTRARSAAACCSAPTSRLQALVAEVTTPWDFGHELLQPDLDRIAPSLEVGFQALSRRSRGRHQAGDQRALHLRAGRQPAGRAGAGLTNFWCACAVMAGLQPGRRRGAGARQLDDDGDPGFDVWGMDVARFGEWATLRYTNAKVRENYSRRFSIRFPNEELPAARPLQTTPLYDIHVGENAVMGVTWGLETRSGSRRRASRPRTSSRSARSNDFEPSARRWRAVREGVGVTEIANFAKYEVTGPGAEAFLDRLLTNRMPQTGRIALTPMLNDAGKLIGDFTVAKAGETASDLGLVGGADLSPALVRAASAG